MRDRKTIFKNCIDAGVNVDFTFFTERLCRTFIIVTLYSRGYINLNRLAQELFV